MSKKKSSWKITRQISTGKLLFSYWDKNNVPKNDLEELEPRGFYDELTYTGYYHTASGIGVKWRSKTYNGTNVISSMSFLDDLFSELIDTKLQIIDVKPLIIKGNFQFVKRGSVIRIIEDEQ